MKHGFRYESQKSESSSSNRLNHSKLLDEQSLGENLFVVQFVGVIRFCSESPPKQFLSLSLCSNRLEASKLLKCSNFSLKNEPLFKMVAKLSRSFWLPITQFGFGTPGSTQFALLHHCTPSLCDLKALILM